MYCCSNVCTRAVFPLPLWEQKEQHNFLVCLLLGTANTLYADHRIFEHVPIGTFKPLSDAPTQ